MELTQKIYQNKSQQLFREMLNRAQPDICTEEVRTKSAVILPVTK